MCRRGNLQLAASLFALATLCRHFATMSNKLGVAVGHRGAGHLEAHNTVAAFTRAAQDQALGLEAIETDLFYTKVWGYPIAVCSLLSA